MRANVPSYYKIYQDDKGHNLRGMAEFIIAKHRNGAVDTVLLRFKSEYARFQDVSDDYVPVPGENVSYGSSMNEVDVPEVAPAPDSEVLTDDSNANPFGPMPPTDNMPF